LDDEEAFFMLEGRLTLIDSAREFQIGPGEMAQFPRGARHGFRNDTDAEVRFLCICTPGIEAAGMFAEMDRAGKTGSLTPENLVELCARYGVHFA
jgi:quercetin dioxygenase-like cupin family protein